jgi:hypothetical protein
MLSLRNALHLGVLFVGGSSCSNLTPVDKGLLSPEAAYTVADIEASDFTRTWGVDVVMYHSQHGDTLVEVQLADEGSIAAKKWSFPMTVPATDTLAHIQRVLSPQRVTFIGRICDEPLLICFDERYRNYYLVSYAPTSLGQLKIEVLFFPPR